MICGSSTVELVDTWFKMSLLDDAKHCSGRENLILPDGGELRVTKAGSVTLKNTSGIRSTIFLTDVYYAPNLAKNLTSLGCLREKGCILKDNGKTMEMTLGNNVLFRVKAHGSVFEAKLRANKRTDVTKRFFYMVMNVATEDVQSDVQEGTLHHSHARLGHLAYDAIERIAKDPR